LLTRHDLEKLRQLGLKEHEDFFQRNPQLRTAYFDSLIAVCLCQGAATHYLKPIEYPRLKDFDIWHFYCESPNTGFPYRAHKRLEKAYMDRPVDFLKRAIPKEIVESHTYQPEKIIMSYLQQRNTETKRLLLQKSIIGLHPERIFAQVLWNPDMSRPAPPDDKKA